MNASAEVLPQIVPDAQPPVRGGHPRLHPRVHPMWRLLLCAASSVVLVSLVFWLVWPTMTAQGRQAGMPLQAVQLPWVFQTPGADNHLVVHMSAGWLTPAHWRVIPDDNLRSITINGRPVALDALPQGALRDYSRGFEIDLGSYFRRGANVIEFTLDNGGGDGGLAFRPRLGLWHALLMTLALSPWLYGLSRIFGLRKAQIALLGAALLAICLYWMATPWHLRTHDAVGVGGHYGYAMWVAENLALPVPSQGWTFYHPPVYYLLAAAVWQWAQWLALPAPELLQAFSVALWLVFLCAAAACLRRALRGRDVALWVATLGLAFWPSGIIHAVRLGNDAALFAACGVAMWFGLRWWQGRRRADVWGMALACALALLCKSNAIALCAALGVLVLLSVWRRNRRKRRAALIDLSVFAGVVSAALGASFAVRVYYYLQGAIPNWLIGNAGGLNSGLSVPVSVKSFLPLDIPTFLTSAWMSPFDDASGRLNFWNYLLRSSLTGEFDFPGMTQRVVAYGWGAGLLVLFAGLFHLSWWRQLGGTARSAYRARPWVLMALMWLGSVLTLRIMTPYSCSNDFRYVLPVLVPALLFWSQAGRLSRLILVLLALGSVVFFATL